MKIVHVRKQYGPCSFEAFRSAGKAEVIAAPGPVLAEGTDPPLKKSYMWTAVGFLDGKPIRRFAYHHSRSGIFADELLKGFSGYLQTDGYSGYDHLEGRKGLVHVGCFAHMRRKFVEAWETAGKTGIAKEAIDLIGKIYAVEARIGDNRH